MLGAWCPLADARLYRCYGVCKVTLEVAQAINRDAVVLFGIREVVARVKSDTGCRRFADGMTLHFNPNVSG